MVRNSVTTRSRDVGASLTRASLVALVTFTISACGAAPPLVRLEAPDMSAARADREAAYCALRVAERRPGAAVHWAGSYTLRGDHGALLADGTEITAVDDLAAILNPRTKTARAIGLRQPAYEEGALLMALGLGLGAGVFGGLMWSMLDNHPDGALWGWAVGGGLTAIVLTTGIRARMQADEQLAEAWTFYDESLRETLFSADEPPPDCGDPEEHRLPPPAPALPPWETVTWDLDIDFNMGRIWQGRDRAAFISRARGGIAIIRGPWMFSGGPTIALSNVTALALGAEIEATHIPTGFWGQLGGFGDVNERAGARAGAGWSIVGTEFMVRVDKHQKASVGWFLKIRVPVSFFVAVSD